MFLWTFPYLKTDGTIKIGIYDRVPVVGLDYVIIEFFVYSWFIPSYFYIEVSLSSANMQLIFAVL